MYNYTKIIFEFYFPNVTEVFVYAAGSAKPSMLACKFWPIFRCLKSYNFLTVVCNDKIEFVQFRICTVFAIETNNI